MNVVVLRYNAGNVLSVENALKRLGIEATLTDQPEQIQAASHIIIPGVGEASSAMSYLRARKLDQVIKNLKQPVLGICLGLQIFCSYSEENDTNCLGIFNEKVKKFKGTLKIPHIGWNTLVEVRGSLFNAIDLNSFVYFVHSYYAEIGSDTIAQTEYVNMFSAALQKDNFYAVQFHPEKSCVIGQKILENFLAL